MPLSTVPVDRFNAISIEKRDNIIPLRTTHQPWAGILQDFLGKYIARLKLTIYILLIVGQLEVTWGLLCKQVRRKTKLNSIESQPKKTVVVLGLVVVVDFVVVFVVMGVLLLLLFMLIPKNEL